MVPPEVLDTGFLERLRALQADGQPDIVTEVTDAYLTDAPERLAALRASIAAADAPTVERVAHGLKGGYAMLGAPRVVELCLTLERQARANELADASDLLEKLETALAEVHAIILAIREGREP